MRGERARLTLILALTCAFALGLGFTLKQPCTKEQELHRFCYTDVITIYLTRFQFLDPFPFTAHPELDSTQPTFDPTQPSTRVGFNEYPVVTALFIWVAAVLSQSDLRAVGLEPAVSEYFSWNVVLLAPFAFGILWLLRRMAPDPRAVLLFAAGTPLVLYAFHNWDLIALFFTILGLHLWEQKRYKGSGAALAAGASAKLFPLVVVPVLLLSLLQRPSMAGRPLRSAIAGAVQSILRPGGARSLLVGFVGTLAVLNGPFLLLGDRELYLASFQYHMARQPNPESLWWSLQFYGARWGWETLTALASSPMVDWVLLVTFVSGYATLAWLVWQGRLGHREAALASILLFMVFNKFFALQYMLWVLPFFALTRLPGWSYAAYAVADVWVYVGIFSFMPRLALIGPEAERAVLFDLEPQFRPVALGILLRFAVLVLLIHLATRGAARGLRSGPGSRRSRDSDQNPPATALDRPPGPSRMVQAEPPPTGQARSGPP